MGFLPLMQRHFVGVRYQSQAFLTTAHSGAEESSTETFYNVDLWGRWQATRRIQVLSALPYSIAERNYTSKPDLRTQGIGDASLQIQYSLLDATRQSCRQWQHYLQAGAGIELPTGAVNKADLEGELLHANLQPGSGSTDYLLNGFYALRHKQWGISADVSGKLPGKNKQAYQFGNRANASLRAFWVKNWSKSSILPYLGLVFDGRDLDRDQGKWQSETGGKMLLAQVGFEMVFSDISFGFGWQLPLAADVAQGTISPKNRFNAGVTWLFTSKNKPNTTVLKPVFSGTKPNQ